MLSHAFSSNIFILILHPSLQVSNSGVVQWTSNGGVFVQFRESGQLTTTNTNITISPLTPSTFYVFKVSMITTKGEGAEVMVKNITDRGIGGEGPDKHIVLWADVKCEELHLHIYIQAKQLMEITYPTSYV